MNGRHRPSLPRSSARVAAAIALTLSLFLSQAPSLAYQRPGKTARVSTHPGGRDPSGTDYFYAPHSAFPSLTENGRLTAFSSTADDLVERDLNEMSDVFVHDRRDRTFDVVSVSSTGDRAVGVEMQGGFIPGSGQPSMSGSGRFVAFPSAAVNLVAGDTNGQTDVFVHDRLRRRTERVSISTEGAQGNADSIAPSISLDGRFIAFESGATNLVRNDRNEHADIFLHDRKKDRTERVSLSTDGTEADDYSVCPSLGASGRYVVFTSWAKNLAPTPGGIQVFIRDRNKDRTELVSEPLDGTDESPPQQGSQSCPVGGRSLSANGRFVVFESHMPDLVPNDGNGVIPGISIEDVFVRDRKTGEIVRASLTSSGEEVDDNSSGATISSDGRYVAFNSLASGLSPEQPPDPPGALSADEDVFVHDLKMGTTEWISRSHDGGATRNEAGFTRSWLPALSAGGRFVAYESNADNIVESPHGPGSLGEIYVRHRGRDLAVEELVSSGRAALISLQGAPRFSTTGIARIPVEGDPVVEKAAHGVKLAEARIIYRPLLEDIFVTLRFEHAGSGSAFFARTAGAVFGLELEVDGRRYEMRAAMPTPQRSSFGLFSCGRAGIRACREMAELEGGFGTSGSEIVASIPLHDLGIEGGAALARMVAYASAGTYETGRRDPAGART